MNAELSEFVSELRVNGWSGGWRGKLGTHRQQRAQVLHGRRGTLVQTRKERYYLYIGSKIYTYQYVCVYVSCLAHMVVCRAMHRYESLLRLKELDEGFVSTAVLILVQMRSGSLQRRRPEYLYNYNNMRSANTIV